MVEIQIAHLRIINQTPKTGFVFPKKHPRNGPAAGMKRKKPVGGKD